MSKIDVTHEQFVLKLKEAAQNSHPLDWVCEQLKMKISTARNWIKVLMQAGVLVPNLPRNTRKVAIDVSKLNELLEQVEKKSEKDE